MNYFIERDSLTISKYPFLGKEIATFGSIKEGMEKYPGLYYDNGVKEFDKILEGLCMAETKSFSNIILFENGLAYFLINKRDTLVLIIDLREVDKIQIKHRENLVFRKRTFFNNAMAMSGGLLGGLIGYAKSNIEKAKTRFANGGNYSFVFKDGSHIDFYVEEFLTDVFTSIKWNELLFNKQYKNILTIDEVIKQRKVVQVGICTEYLQEVGINFNGYEKK